MTDTIISAILAAGCGIAAFGVLIWVRMSGYRRGWRRMAADGPSGPDKPTALEDGFLLARYQPMFRLLAGGDAEFLSHETRCPKIAQRWERSHRRVVRLYLKELATDFHVLHREARALVARSPEQYAGMVPLLFKLQISFWRALIWIEIRLSLRLAGIPRINPEALVEVFESMRRELSHSLALAKAQPG